ncbi:hypothetical protein MCOR05_010969 [Pyricularia oryzae]|nr:hypothetical protein MCOR05_010969 [Pyricularia oryzae]
MRRKKPRIANVRARRPLKQKWPPNRDVLLESYLDSTLPFAVVESPTKRICNRRAASAATSQIVCPVTTSKEHQLAHGYSDSLDPKSGCLATVDETTTFAQGSSAPVFENKKPCETGSAAEERNNTAKARFHLDSFRSISEAEPAHPAGPTSQTACLPGNDGVSTLLKQSHGTSEQ